MKGPEGYNPTETQAEQHLPSERLRAVKRWHVFGEWAVMALVVLAVNVGAFIALKRYDPNRFDVQVVVKYERLREDGGKFDSLILGDSTANQGLMPRVFNEQLGGAWLNLATVANMLAVSDAWQLDEYIKKNGAPRRVIVCHVPDMWARKADPGVMGKAPIAMGDFEKLVPPIKWSLKDRVLVLGNRYVPIYSKSTSLSEMVKKPWALRDLRADFGADGFMAVKGQAKDWEAAVAAAILEHEKDPYELSEINTQAMAAVIALAEQHGFNVYLTPGSVSGPLAESPGYRRNYEAMLEQYRRWAESSERVFLALPDPVVFDDAMMFDEDHVNVEGAEVWSGRLADAIKAAERSAERGGETP